MSNKKSENTENSKETEKFSELANEWWDENGAFKILHQINPLRLQYIHNRIKPNTKILDIGCGGGLIAIPLAKTQKNITALDSSAQNIAIVNEMAKRHKVTNHLNTFHGTIENFRKNNKETFDTLLAIEVIEHVENPEFFLSCCAKLLKKDGILILSTFNRTIKSFLQGIIAAEYILRWVPKGTHAWNKFLKPEEILMKININSNFLLADVSGIKYNPILKNWYLSENTDVNYIMTLQKK